MPGISTTSAAVHSPAREHRAVGGEAGQRNRRRLLVAQSRRLRIDVFRRHRDVLGERAVVRHAEYRAVRTPQPRIVTPPEHRIDDDAGPDGGALDARAERGDDAAAVRAGDHRENDPRIESLRDEHVAPVEGGAAHLHQNLARTGDRRFDLLDVQVRGAADLV